MTSLADIHPADTISATKVRLRSLVEDNGCAHIFMLTFRQEQSNDELHVIIKATTTPSAAGVLD